jgi:hypothetical protein
MGEMTRLIAADQIDAALKELAKLDRCPVGAVELKYSAGLTNDEIAATRECTRLLARLAARSAAGISR